jgi:RHS repeat-associated protein
MAAVIAAATATTPVLPLAALSLFAEKPHQGHRTAISTFRLGTTLAISNTATGMPVCLYDSGTRPCCSGKERDGERGLDYFGARYYGSAMGRFTSPDRPFADQHPEDPQSWNLYSYVRNNPLRFIDPTGRDCVSGISSGLSDESLNGQACFTATATSDVPIKNPYFNAVAQGVNQAGPVVRALAVATPAVPVVAVGAAAVLGISGTTVAAGGTAVTAGVTAAESPQGQQTVAGLLPAAERGVQWAGEITSSVTESASVMYRVWGGASEQVGAWVTPNLPASASQAIATLSLPPGNTANFVSQVVVPAGTRIQTGVAAPLFQQVGGAVQVLVLQYLPIINFGPGIPLR